MYSFFIESYYLVVLALFITLLLARELLRKRKISLDLWLSGISLSVYSVTPLLPLSDKVKYSISVMALSVLIVGGVYKHLEALISKSLLKQKKRALKKIPILIIVVFYSLLNLLPMELCYLMIGVGLLLVRFNLRVAFFSWPFLLSGFLPKSAIIELLIVGSQFLSIYLLKDGNEQ